MSVICPIISENLVWVRELPEVSVNVRHGLIMAQQRLLAQSADYFDLPAEFRESYTQKINSRVVPLRTAQRHLEENCENYYRQRETGDYENHIILKKLFFDLYEIYENGNYIFRQLNDYLGLSGLRGADKYFIPMVPEGDSSGMPLPTAETIHEEFYLKGNKALLESGRQLSLYILNVYSLYKLILQSNQEKLQARHDYSWVLSLNSDTGNTLRRHYRDLVGILLQYDQAAFFDNNPGAHGIFYHQMILAAVGNSLAVFNDFIDRR